MQKNKGNKVLCKLIYELLLSVNLGSGPCKFWAKT